MSFVRDIRLNIARRNEQDFLADLQFNVEFSPAEVSRNMNFGIYAALFGNDERSNPFRFDSRNPHNEFFMPQFPGADYPGFQNRNMNGGNGNFNGYAPREFDNGFILWIARERLTPNQNQNFSFNRKATFDLRTLNLPYNEFRAYVWVVPEIFEGKAVSNNFRLNSGYAPSYGQGYAPGTAQNYAPNYGQQQYAQGYAPYNSGEYNY